MYFGDKKGRSPTRLRLAYEAIGNWWRPTYELTHYREHAMPLTAAKPKSITVAPNVCNIKTAKRWTGKLTKLENVAALRTVAYDELMKRVEKVNRLELRAAKLHAEIAAIKSATNAATHILEAETGRSNTAVTPLIAHA